MRRLPADALCEREECGGGEYCTCLQTRTRCVNRIQHLIWSHQYAAPQTLCSRPCVRFVAQGGQGVIPAGFWPVRHTASVENSGRQPGGQHDTNYDPPGRLRSMRSRRVSEVAVRDPGSGQCRRFLTICAAPLQERIPCVLKRFRIQNRSILQQKSPRTGKNRRERENAALTLEIALDVRTSREPSVGSRSRLE